MKLRLILLTLLFPTVLAFWSCNDNSTKDTMTDEEILKVLDVKIHKQPKNDVLYYDRASVYLRMGRVNDAIADLSRAVSINNKDHRYYALMGDAYFANGDMGHSYESLQKVLELSPGNFEAELKLGEIAYYSKDFDRAMDHLGKVTAHDPQNRTALTLKSFIYKETGDTSNAVVLLRKVCDLYPDYAMAYEELGMLYALHHDPLALEYLNTALRLEPNNTNALYTLAMYHQELGHMEQAEEVYKQILDIDSDYKWAWHNRGYIEMFTYGDYPVAVEYMTRAIQCDSSFIEAWTNRGCAYELMGDKARALDDFKAALDIDRTHQPAIDGLSRVKN